MSARQAPDQRAAYAYFCDISTRWSDNDAYRHVNNVVYYSFFDTAVNEYLIRNGGLDVENSPVVGLVVETQCRYFSPVAFPDRLQVGVRVAHMGNSSVRYELAIFREEEKLACAQGYFIHVYVDRQSHRSVSLPEPTRSLVAALQRPEVASAD